MHTMYLTQQTKAALTTIAVTDSVRVAPPAVPPWALLALPCPPCHGFLPGRSPAAPPRLWPERAPAVAVSFTARGVSAVSPPGPLAVSGCPPPPSRFPSGPLPPFWRHECALLAAQTLLPGTPSPPRVAESASKCYNVDMSSLVPIICCLAL
jgi:hypothetical protein